MEDRNEEGGKELYRFPGKILLQRSETERNEMGEREINKSANEMNGLSRDEVR